VELTFYTDPLCCWSWALLAEIEKLERAFPEKICVEICMGGMIQSWNNFEDPLNSVNRPSQMGPIWMDAKAKTGIPFDDRIWVDDPPSSSFPACIAVKTAELQSKAMARDFLILLMRGVMLEGKNISKPEILVEIADKLSLQNLDFNKEQFLKEYNQDLSREAFRRDIQKAKMNNIGRYPTITMIPARKRGIIITGYRPFQTLKEAFLAITSV